MKPLFVSKEILVKRTYRQGLGFRVAGAAVMLALVAQLAVAFIAFRNAPLKSDLEYRQRLLQAESAVAAKELQKLGPLENQLAQLKIWEPILRTRLPAAALLSNIEQGIPPELVLSKVDLNATLRTPVKLEGGVYVMPKAYRLTIEGEQSGASPDPVTRFSQTILAKLPPESKELLKKVNEPDVHRISQFSLIFSIPADGNYYNLGLTKIQQPESL